MKEYYTSKEVAKFTGLSLSQINRYVHNDLITPSVNSKAGTGNQWLFGFDNLVQLRVIKRMLDTGLTPKKIKQAKSFLSQHLNQSIEGSYLILDGNNVYVKSLENEIIDIVRHGQFVITIALGEIYQDILTRLDEKDYQVATLKQKTKNVEPKDSLKTGISNSA